MIFQRNLLFIFTFLCGMSLYAQTYKIKGKVLDENKLPIKEASVKDILTGTSVFTDKGGNYSLELQEEYPTLQVSKEGYTTIEFSVVLQNNENREQ